MNNLKRLSLAGAILAASTVSMACTTEETASNDSDSNATPGLCSGVTLYGSISDRRDVDWIEFQVASAGEITINLDHSTSNDFDWDLYALTGSALATGATSQVLETGSYNSTRQVLEGLTRNQELISVLTGQWGDYGQTPRDAAFMMHALIAKHYLAGGAYPVGGASSIARTIIPTIQAAGGEVFTYAEVDTLLIENNRCVGVKMDNGDELRADNVISNIGFMNTVKRLLPSEAQQKLNVEKWLDEPSIERSAATHCLYAGFKGTAKDLGINTTNLWIYPDGRHEENLDNYLAGKSDDLPLVYVSFPSSKDPDWDNRYPGKSTVEIVTIANMDDYEAWNGTTWQQRGDDYEAKKEALSQRLLSILFERMPQLKDALDYYELSTPLSTQFYQLNERGEIYGLNHYVERFKQSCLHPQMPIKNLYMTGADVMTAGVGGALMGGVMTSMCLLGPKKGKQVMALFKNYQEPEQQAKAIEA